MGSPNVQFGTEVEHKDFDKGTGAWAIKPGPAEIPEVPAVPGSVVLSEDFEGPLWTEITEVSGTWVTTTAHSHSATTSYTNPDINDGESASFTIQNDAFDAQVSFWLRTDTESGFDKFQVFIDSVEVYSESGFNDWHRVAIPTGFGFIIEFRYTKDGSVSSGDDACWVDDIVQGSLDTLAVPAVPARPFVYTPLKMTDDGERLKVEASFAAPAVPALTDDGGPAAFTGPGSIADSTFRSVSLVVTQGTVTVNGVSVKKGFTLSRSADSGGTVPGFTFDGTGGEIIVDTLREI